VKRILVLAAAAALVMVSVPFATAGTTAPPRHVEGSFATVGDPYSASFLFEVRANSYGRAEFGYYQFEMPTPSAAELPNRTQATVETVRFFKAASGAPAAEFTGHECVLASPDSAAVGSCTWYHIIVTDGASIRKPDTFCGAGVATECYYWTPTYGDIRIY
jgi:hypothetical protein